VGIVLNLVPVWPHSPSEADRDAARQLDGRFNRWYLDPLFHGRYPEDVIADRVRSGHLPEAHVPGVQPGDLAAIATPLDFLGLNYYSRVIVRGGPDGKPVAVPGAEAAALTQMGWEVFPQGLYDMLMRLKREYGPPKIYVTENGAAYVDGAGTAGGTTDGRRREFLRSHLVEAHRAIADGVALRGYFVWSLLDNFEWGHGYTQHFGLYQVDSATQRRIAKDSAHWYRDVVAASAVDGATQASTTRRLR
jgi:beta-glucosidase